jgi:hypothetical protein
VSEKKRREPRRCVVYDAAEPRNARGWSTVHLTLQMPGLPDRHIVGRACSPAHMIGAVEQLSDSARELLRIALS